MKRQRFGKYATRQHHRLCQNACMLSNTMLCYVQNSRRVKVLSESENHEDHIRYSCHESTRCLVPTKRDFVAYVHSAYIVSQGCVTLQCSVGFVESQTIILLEWCTQQGIHLQFKLHVLSLIFVLRKINLSKQAYLLIVRSAHKCLESQEQRYLTIQVVATVCKCILGRLGHHGTTVYTTLL